MFKKLTHIIILFASLFLLTSCSAVSRDYYYSPSAENGEHVRQSATMNPIYCSGPADHVVLTDGNISIDVSVRNIEHSSISVGPLIFPVIPVFCLDWFSEKKKAPEQLIVSAEFVKVPDDFNTAMLEYKVKLLTDKLVLTTKDGKRLTPANAGFDWEDLLVIYNIDTSDLDWFKLSFGGILFDKKQLSFPEVEFKKAGGWVWHPIR